MFVAIENIFVSDLKAWRIGIVFLFGLLHGMGFASALSEIACQEINFLLLLFLLMQASRQGR
jgi:hypothetical protein